MTDTTGVQPAEFDQKSDFVLSDAGEVKPVPDKEEPAKAPEVKEPDQPDEQSEDDSDTEQEGSEGKKRRSGGYKKKIARLEAQLAELMAEKQKPKVEQSSDKPASASSEPQLESFNSYDEYAKAFTKWAAKQAILDAKAERDAEVANQKATEIFETRQKAYQANVEQVKKDHPDFDKAIAEFDDVVLTKNLHRAILDSDMGAEVVYYLAKNPDEFERLNSQAIDGLALNRVIGRIEAKLEAEKTQAESAVKKVTKAPPPISGVKGSAKTTPPLEELDYDAYRKARGFK